MKLDEGGVAIFPIKEMRSQISVLARQPQSVTRGRWIGNCPAIRHWFAGAKSPHSIAYLVSKTFTFFLSFSLSLSLFASSGRELVPSPPRDMEEEEEEEEGRASEVGLRTRDGSTVEMEMGTEIENITKSVAVYGDSSPHMDFTARRNGFRPTSKNAFMTRNEQNMQLAAFRHSHTPMADPLSSLSIGPTPCPPGAPGTLRGQSIGFGSREGTMVSGLNASCGSSSSQGRAGNVKSRTRSIFLSGQSEKYRQNQYQFQDPAFGAASDFQQRLAELTALETDTVRYERTKKAKKKAKQDSG
ncbi:uncharacterized protein [Diadema antillarum]|uniref:uncharacterized protein n=1 Tax=Diadema antillarum TaxID=105358 RepID=UPI003A8920DB